MRRSWTLWAAILLSFVVTAAACGGDDEGSAGDDADTETPNDGADGNVPDDNAGEGLEGDQLTDTGEGADDPPSDPVHGGELEWGLNRDGTGFDTTGAVAPGSIRLINAMSDPLVGVTKDGGWAPNLAESLVPNDDFTVWTITMRPGVTFHDGEPVTGEAVAANLNAFNNAPLTSFAFVPVEEAVATGALTVEVRMNQPWGAFPFILTGQPGWMVSPDTIGNNDEFVSTGPFMLESWEAGAGARVVRNPNYWREGLPHLDAINFTFISEQASRRLALEGNEVDGYISPGDADILEFLEDDSIDVWIGEANGNEMLYLLNTEVPPLDDLRVRRALAHAVDRQVVVDAFRSGLTVPANSPIHPGSRWYVETDYPDYDPDEAKRLIAEYEAEVGPVEFQVSSESGASFIEVTELVMSFWEEAGVDVSIRDVALGQSAATAVNDEFEVFAWIQFSAADPDGLYTFFHSSSGLLNWTNYVSEGIDNGLALGRENVDPDLRADGYAMFQQALAEEVPVVWIDHFNGIESAVSRPYVHGIKDGLLPDGEETIGMLAGSFFSWEDVWMEPQG